MLPLAGSLLPTVRHIVMCELGIPSCISPMPYSTTKQAQPAAQMCAGWPQAAASRRKAYLAAAGCWSGSRAVPGSLHGGQMATYGVPATHTVSRTLRFQRKMQWEGMGQVQDVGDMAEVTCSRAITPLSGFWWGSAPQMLLVQQPEWLIHGCKHLAKGNLNIS